jgi:TPR repeat protein
MDASHKSYERDHWPRAFPNVRYAELIKGFEDYLLTEWAQRHWGIEALAELSIGTGFIHPDRGIRYLFDAAEAGYLKAQLELAQMADDELIPPPEYFDAETDRKRIPFLRWEEFNRSESDRWWKAAAENDSALAQYVMCCGLIESDDPDDFAQGVKWLKRAASNRRPHPVAQYDLAYLMELERIDPDDPRDRWRLYEAAANVGISEAMLAVGHYLEYGIGIEQDVKAAVDWYRKAAESGHGEGYLLAGLLSDDDSDLEKAANGGHVAAMLILAKREMDRSLDMYGFDSFQAGLNYFDNAASTGSLEAILALAEIYEDGRHGHSHGDWWMQFGLDSEFERLESALAYYELAQMLGWEFAAENIDRVQKRLDSHDVGRSDE